MIYIHVDHLNTPKVVTDQSQTPAWKADYRPFGEIEATVTTLNMPLRFPGQYDDQETGLNYNYFRSYNPTVGRYTQSDPIGLDGGLNTYGYVGANPIVHFDPMGLSSCGAEGGTVFPSHFGAWSFENACATHDACYGTCGADKDKCDSEFLGDMVRECNKIKPSTRPVAPSML